MLVERVSGSAWNPQSDASIFVKINDNARIIGFARANVYALISEGEVGAVKLGKSKRITTSSLHHLIRRQRGSA